MANPAPAAADPAAAVAVPCGAAASIAAGAVDSVTAEAEAGEETAIARQGGGGDGEAEEDLALSDNLDFLNEDTASWRFSGIFSSTSFSITTPSLNPPLPSGVLINWQGPAPAAASPGSAAAAGAPATADAGPAGHVAAAHSVSVAPPFSELCNRCTFSAAAAAAAAASLAAAAAPAAAGDQADVRGGGGGTEKLGHSALLMPLPPPPADSADLRCSNIQAGTAAAAAAEGATSAESVDVAAEAEEPASVAVIARARLVGLLRGGGSGGGSGSGSCGGSGGSRTAPSGRSDLALGATGGVALLEQWKIGRYRSSSSRHGSRLAEAEGAGASQVAAGHSVAAGPTAGCTLAAALSPTTAGTMAAARECSTGVGTGIGVATPSMGYGPLTDPEGEQTHVGTAGRAVADPNAEANEVPAGLWCDVARYGTASASGLVTSSSLTCFKDELLPLEGRKQQHQHQQQQQQQHGQQQQQQQQDDEEVEKKKQDWQQFQIRMGTGEGGSFSGEECEHIRKPEPFSLEERLQKLTSHLPHGTCTLVPPLPTNTCSLSAPLHPIHPSGPEEGKRMHLSSLPLVTTTASLDSSLGEEDGIGEATGASTSAVTSDESGPKWTEEVCFEKWREREGEQGKQEKQRGWAARCARDPLQYFRDQFCSNCKRLRRTSPAIRKMLVQAQQQLQQQVLLQQRLGAAGVGGGDDAELAALLAEFKPIVGRCSCGNVSPRKGATLPPTLLQLVSMSHQANGTQGGVRGEWTIAGSDADAAAAAAAAVAASSSPTASASSAAAAAAAAAAQGYNSRADGSTWRKYGDKSLQAQKNRDSKKRKRGSEEYGEEGSEEEVSQDSSMPDSRSRWARGRMYFKCTQCTRTAKATLSNTDKTQNNSYPHHKHGAVQCKPAKKMVQPIEGIRGLFLVRYEGVHCHPVPLAYAIPLSQKRVNSAPADGGQGAPHQILDGMAQGPVMDGSGGSLGGPPDSGLLARHVEGVAWEADPCGAGEDLDKGKVVAQLTLLYDETVAADLWCYIHAAAVGVGAQKMIR